MRAEHTARRSFARWKVEQRPFDSLAEFERARDLDHGIYTINGHALPIDFYLRATALRPLIITFHGAAQEHLAVTLPLFSGIDLAAERDVSILAFSDPALYLDETLRIGWFAGTSSMDIPFLLSCVVDKIISYLSPTQVIVLGGSAGGFAALNFSAYLKNTTICVWNPQLALLQYNRGLVAHYFGLAHAKYTRAEIESHIRSTPGFDLISRRWLEPSSNQIIYMQNLSDHHYDRQLLPLLHAVGRNDVVTREPGEINLTDRFRIILADWGEGHAPPPRHLLGRCLDLLLSGDIDAASTILRT